MLTFIKGKKMTLREWLSLNSLYGKEFSDMIGINNTALSSILNGRRIPSRKFRMKILEATNGEITQYADKTKFRLTDKEKIEATRFSLEKERFLEKMGKENAAILKTFQSREHPVFGDLR